MKRARPLTVNEQVRVAFALATLRRAADTVQTPAQWRQISVLQARCEWVRAKEKDRYAARYQTRVEIRRRQLVDEAARKAPSLKPGWAGQDRFDPEATLRQAQRDVRDAHAARLLRIDAIERDGLARMLKAFGRLNERRGFMKDDFGRATDRRIGIERRRIRKIEH